MDQLRRRLPHEWAEGKRLFVTWHLSGSLPHALYPPPNRQNAGQARAGLVANAEDYLWSSAARKAEMNLGPAGLTACATVSELLLVSSTNGPWYAVGSAF